MHNPTVRYCIQNTLHTGWVSTGAHWIFQYPHPRQSLCSIPLQLAVGRRFETDPSVPQKRSAGSVTEIHTSGVCQTATLPVDTVRLENLRQDIHLLDTYRQLPEPQTLVT